MKLLFTIKSIAVKGGGAERVLANISEELVNRGYQIYLLTFDKEEVKSFYSFDPRIKLLFLDIGNSQVQTNFIDLFKRINRLRKIIKEIVPDVIIPFMCSTFIPTGMAMLGDKTPIIASEHNVFQNYKNRKLVLLLFLLLQLKFRKITIAAVSKKNKGGYPWLIKRKMQSIPNPVQNFEGIKKEYNRNIILSIGSLDNQKNHADLIHAFASLAKKYPDWNVHIIGEGKLRPALEKLITNYNLQDRVHLPGSTQHIEREYAKATIFAMPSLYESVGLVTAEAMLYGLPVVGFADCPGTNELITNNQNGILVSGQNKAHAFAQGLEQLICSQQLRERLGQQAKKELGKYSIKNVVDQWEKLIKKVAYPCLHSH